MSNMLMNPIRGRIYNLVDVEVNLYLRDSPCLMVLHKGEYHPIQTSSLIPEQTYLKNEKLAKSEWIYIKTTDEWIPVFHCKDPNFSIKFCTIQEFDTVYGKEVAICFKGFERDFIQEAKDLGTLR